MAYIMAEKVARHAGMIEKSSVVKYITIIESKAITTQIIDFIDGTLPKIKYVIKIEVGVLMVDKIATQEIALISIYAKDNVNEAATSHKDIKKIIFFFRKRVFDLRMYKNERRETEK